MRRGLAVLGLALAVLSGSSAMAGIEKVDSEWSHDMRVATFCIEGHLFVVAISDVGKGGGTAITQVYHQENGKVVPKPCTDSMVNRGKSDKDDKKR